MPAPPFDFLIAALATWRLSYMLANEQGPSRVFFIVRERLGGAFNCIYCISVWVAIVCTALIYFNFTLILYPLAISGAAMMLRSYTGAGMHDV